jgi:hypothetical protein
LDAPTLTSWLRDNTSLSPQMVVSIGSSSIIGLRGVVATPAAGPGMYRAGIWAEIVSAETAGKGRYLSWSADVQVDCPQRRSKAMDVVNYTQRDLKGLPKPVAGAADWVAPSPGTQLYSLISAVCDPSFRRPFATVAVAHAAPSPPPLAAEPARVAAVQPAPAKAAAQEPPEISEAEPQLAVSLAAAKTPPETLATAEPAAPAPSKPVAQREPPQAAATKPAPRRTAATPPVATGHSRAAIQIAAADSQTQAAQALKTAQRKFGPRLEGLDSSVAKTDVGGKTVYRALLHGFAARSDATALCDALQGQGMACFVRNDFGPR